jgi:hypothetical protein
MIEELNKLKEFFSDEKRWTQIAFARNDELIETSIHNDDAVCWCALGAACKLGLSTETIRILNDSSWIIFKRSTSDVNDQLGYDAIIEVIDFTILEEEAKQKTD